MMKVRDLGGFIRDRRRDVGLSVRTLARLAGVSNPYLSQIERGLRKPSAEIISGIAKALRISAETLYVQAGILDERKRRPADVVGSISDDESLTARQKEALVQIYRSFRDETQRRRERRKRTVPRAAAESRAKPGGRVETAG
jgi:transcriptional regulator with XRE-family HTH domain